MAIDKERAAFAKERAHAENALANLRAASQADLLAHKEERESLQREVREAQTARVRSE